MNESSNAPDQETFEGAQARVKGLKKTPQPAELLTLYALFKQATQGPCLGKRPGMLDMRGRAKFDAWSGQKDKSSDLAKQEYVALVDELEKTYGG